MAYLDSANVEDLVADIKDLADLTYASINHTHPIRTITYSEVTGSFLDWVLATFTNTNDKALVILDTNNYMGLPLYGLVSPLVYQGCFEVIKEGSIISITSHLTSQREWTNLYDGTAWAGWNKVWISAPAFTYRQDSGNFLDYLVSTIIPIEYGTNENGTSIEVWVPFNTTNYTGWPASKKGVAHVFTFGTYYFVLAYLVDGTAYINSYNSSWSGWQLMTPDSNVSSELEFNNGGILTTSLSGATLSRAAIKRAGQVYTISAEISGISQDLNNVQILNLPSGYVPMQTTIIYGFFTTEVEETYTQIENIVSGATLTDGKAIVVATGDEASRTGYTDTDYIPVENGKTYTVSPVFNGSYGFAFYKADKTYISGLASTDANKTFVTPWNAEYVRLTVATNQKSNFKFNRVDNVKKETKIIAPILLSADGYAYAYPPSGYTYTRVELAGAFGHFMT